MPVVRRQVGSKRWKKMSDGERQHIVDAMWKTAQLKSSPKDTSPGHKNKKYEKMNGPPDKAPPVPAPVLAGAPVANEVDARQKYPHCLSHLLARP
jgi:hypothetical protein